MRRVVVIAVAVAGSGALAALLPPAALAHSVSKTPKGAVVRWTHKVISVGPDASAPSRYLPEPAVREALIEAGGVWSVLPESRIVFQRPGADATANVRVRFIGRNWSERPDRFAMTHVRADDNTGVAESATVDVNEERYELTQKDLQAVLVHELGHVLGLGHSTLASAVMFETSSLDVTRLSPTADDRKGLAEIYGSVQIRALSVVQAPITTTKVSEGRMDLSRCVKAIGGGFLVGPCPEVPASIVKARK